MPLIQRPVRSIRLSSVYLAGVSVAALLLGSASAVPGQDDPASKLAIAEDLFQFAPTTPDQILEAAIITQKLNRHDDSRRFVRELLDLKLSDTELRTLRQRVGAGPFLELSGDRKIQPEARDLLLAVNAASRSQALSSAELQELIQALAPASEAATQAAVALIANGDNSVVALLAADPDTPAGKVADQLLVRHARDMRKGLMAQLRSSDSASRVRILKFLAGTADPNIATSLLRWQFDPESDAAVRLEAAHAIEKLAQSRVTARSSSEASELLTQRGLALLTASAGRFTHTRQPAVVDELTSRDLRAELLNDATNYLTDAAALDPANLRASRLLLVARSAATDPAVSAEASVAAGQSVPDLEAALSAALEVGEVHAGIELLRGLVSSDFSSMNPRAQATLERALNSALNSLDPRVRFLACNVVGKISPSEINSLAVRRTRAAIHGGSLKPEAVVIDSDDRSLRDLGVALENAGYSVIQRQTGQEGFDAAAGQMSCELILVDAESAGWPLATTLANFRADIRTRDVPIVVIGPDRFAQRVSRLSEIHPGVWFLSEPVGIETLTPKLDSLLLPPHLLSPDDRAVMKRTVDKNEQ